LEGRRALTERIAKERISILFSLAEERASSEPGLAKSYIRILERIRRHYHVRLPKRMKARICHNCSMILVPGLNCKVTVASSSKIIIYRCMACGKEKHIVYK
jgi:ribonuclease P protein subunit RPR2